jgi:hypothetical protein
MRKSDLVQLIQAIRQTYDGDINIVGSQASYAVSLTPPSIVVNSMEGDIIMLDDQIRAKLTKSFGRFSEYEAQNDITLDVLTTRSVILPSGWETRRLPIMDLDRSPIPGVFAADIHDVACAKLIAGREKDFVFLTEFTRSLDIKVATLGERARLVEDHYRYNVIPERTMKWGHFMEGKKLRAEASSVFELAKALTKEAIR